MSLLAQDDRLTRRVGAVTLVMLASTIAFFVFVSGSVGGGDSLRIRIFLHHTGGLMEGAPLVVAGKPVGRIETIARSPRGGPGPLNGDEGIVAVVAIEREAATRISRGGDVFVASHGVLSDRYLELGTSPETGVPYREGEEVLGRDPPSLDRVLQRTWNNLMIAKAFADAVRPDARAFAAELQALVDNLALAFPETMLPSELAIELTGLVAEARRLRDTTLGGDDGLARLDAVIRRGRGVIVQARKMLDTLSAQATTLSSRVDGMRTRLDPKTTQFLVSLDLAIARGKAALDKIDPLLAQIQILNDRLARGEGSIGRLMRDPEFPEDAKELGKILKRQPWKIISRPPDK